MAKTTKPAKSGQPEAVSKPPVVPETLTLILTSLDDMKAEDIVTIDLAGKTTMADYMVVSTGRSARHVSSTAESVMKALHAAGIRNIRHEGLKQGDWVLIDAGDVIVHLFRDEVRSFYNLEKMWLAATPEGQRPN